MADIELVIKIDDRLYNRIKWLEPRANTMLDELMRSVQNGTPLPKGRGDLVDYDEMKNNAREYGAYVEATLSHIKPKTLIEADKENRHDKYRISRQNTGEPV